MSTKRVFLLGHGPGWVDPYDVGYKKLTDYETGSYRSHRRLSGVYV